jgi:hypothetical protein
VRLAGFLILNLLLLGAWWPWFARRLPGRRIEPLVYAGLAVASQLVLAEIVLGMVGRLTLPVLLAALVSVSAVVAALALRLPRPAPVAGGVAARDLLGPLNLFLLALALVLTAWLALATWLLPPRGVDDMAYHLPPLYEFARSGMIFVLPLQLRVQFALPLGGDLLYLWPLVFFGADTWVDGVQFVVACYGALVLCALARAFGLGRREALGLGLLFLFTPVVIGQAASNYNDVITAVCHLVVLYALVRFWQEGTLLHLVMAGLASGFGLGAKYTMIVPVLGAQPLIWLRLWKDGGVGRGLARYAAYAAACAVLPAYWLLRNWLTTGVLLFPYEVSPGGLTAVSGAAVEVAATQAGAEVAGSALRALVEEPLRLAGFVLQDPGLGSLNGGLGLVFFGLGVPALAWCGARALREARAGELFPLLFWGQALLVLAMFLAQIDVSRLQYNMRLLIVLVPFGLLALGLARRRLAAELPAVAAAIPALAASAAVLALVQLAGYSLPALAFTEPLADRSRGRVTSDYRYYPAARKDMASLATAWDPLDYLTRDGPGWNVYMAADWDVFYLTPLYGSRLQNRFWNFLYEAPPEPDALIFHAGFEGGSEQLFYTNEDRRITPQQVARNPRYELVTISPPTEFWVRRDLLAAPATRARLTEFYRRRYAGDIGALREVLTRLPADAVVVAAGGLGHGLKGLGLAGELALPVELVRRGDEQAAARRLGAASVVTAGARIPGYDARELAVVQTPQGPVSLYLNTVRP